MPPSLSTSSSSLSASKSRTPHHLKSALSSRANTLFGFDLAESNICSMQLTAVFLLNHHACFGLVAPQSCTQGTQKYDAHSERGPLVGPIVRLIRTRSHCSHDELRGMVISSFELATS